MNIINNILLNQNQIIDAVFHSIGSLSEITTPVDGQFVYVNTIGSTQGFYYRKNTEWVKIPITAETVSTLTSSNSTITFTESVDINGFKTIEISIADATVSESGLLSASDKEKLDNATNLSTSNTLVERDADGRARVENPSNAKDIVNKQYLEEQISLLSIDNTLKPPTNYDVIGATTANFPSGAKKGDTYIIINPPATGCVLGVANTKKVNSKDLLISINGNPSSTTNGNDWLVIESNRSFATDSEYGVVKLLKTAITPGETLTNNDGEAVAPSALENFSRQYKTNFTTTTDVEYIITHNMGKPLVELNISLKDSTGNDLNVFKENIGSNSFKFVLRAPVIESQTYYVTVTG